MQYTQLTSVTSALRTTKPRGTPWNRKKKPSSKSSLIRVHTRTNMHSQKHTFANTYTQGVDSPFFLLHKTMTEKTHTQNGTSRKLTIHVPPLAQKVLVHPPAKVMEVVTWNTSHAYRNSIVKVSWYSVVNSVYMRVWKKFLSTSLQVGMTREKYRYKVGMKTRKKTT